MVRYFNWLQKDNPVGEVERYPELDAHGQTTLAGVYVAGDLTGIPLLKLAVESGAKVIRHLAADSSFQREREELSDPNVHDILVLGAGPAGISAALECRKLKLRFILLESAQPFQTLENFPVGKPILAKPDHYVATGPLSIEDGTKESLLAALKQRIEREDLALKTGRAVQIRRQGSLLCITTEGETLKSLRVVLAIGKSGDARKLGVPGENLPHVFNRLFDPGEFHNRDVMIVGGGDSALESAVALARSGNRVRLSYRKDLLDRPKSENVEALQSEIEKGRIETYFGTEVEEILPESVRLKGRTIITLPADPVFLLIGREQPIAFFRRSGIHMAGDRYFRDYLFLTTMIAFFTMLYCGKAGVARDIFAGASGSKEFLIAYLLAPFRVPLSWSLAYHAWSGSLGFLLGWLGSWLFGITGLWTLGITLMDRKRYWANTWTAVKHGYFVLVAALFLWVHFHYLLNQNADWVEGPVYWYSLTYTVTILFFGLRRIFVRKTRYIRYQVLVLALVQGFFLFLLPFYLFDALIQPHLDPHGWILREIFPSGKWSSFGFVLFWPLNMGDFGLNRFWTLFPLFQTFIFLPWLVFRYGKGAYCGWICSCGGMAETLGDEVRQKAPHGPKAKSLENMGQWVLVFAVIVTLLGLVTRGLSHSLVYDTLHGIYKVAIDMGFAGVAGLGLYFFWGGRVWCRYGCPLAALMHIYSRYSIYRILSEKKKCISCNVCTKVCHMGIDVMGFANKGIPLNDVQCVRCSACVQSCPTETLSFGTSPSDPNNNARIPFPALKSPDWKSGLN